MNNTQFYILLATTLGGFFANYFQLSNRIDKTTGDLGSRIDGLTGRIDRLNSDVTARIDKVGGDLSTFYRELGAHGEAIETLKARPH